MRLVDAVTLIIVLLLSWSFYRLHRDPESKFNVFDLIMENGRVSRLAFAFMTLLGVSSWVVVRLVVENKMTEGYFGLYGTMWVAPIIARMFSPPVPPSITTDTHTHTQEIK